MANLLEQAIDADDGDRAAKIILDASASNPTTWRTMYFRKPRQLIAGNAPASSASGCRPRRGSWLSKSMPGGRRGRPPPWWWRTEVLVLLAAVLAVLLVAAYLKPPFPRGNRSGARRPRHGRPSTIMSASRVPIVALALWERRK